MKTILSIPTLIFLLNTYSFEQSLDSPLDIDGKKYFYTVTKKLTSQANPEEGKAFTVPKNAVWRVSVKCKLCYLRTLASCKYITNEKYGFRERQSSGNIAWDELPVIFFEGASFVLHSNSQNSIDYLSVEEYKIPSKPKK